jgi:ribosomal protein L37AE/L43A
MSKMSVKIDCHEDNITVTFPDGTCMEVITESPRMEKEASDYLEDSLANAYECQECGSPEMDDSVIGDHICEECGNSLTQEEFEDRVDKCREDVISIFGMSTNVCDKCGVRYMLWWGANWGDLEGKYCQRCFQDVSGKIPEVIPMENEFSIKPVNKKYSTISKALEEKYRR